jgi:very-short-patch-repair endonuclease
MLGLSSGLEAPREPTRSELEDRFLRLCSQHGLPAPEVNVRVGSRLVDFLWRAERVVVETDGYRYHRGVQAFEDDHDRNLEMRGLGFDLIRLSYRQVTENPGAAAGYVREALKGRYTF